MLSPVVLVLLVRFALLIRGKCIVLLILSIFIGSFKLLIGNLTFLLLEVFSACSVLQHDTILVTVNIDPVIHFPIVIQVSLSILDVLVIPFARIFHVFVAFTTILYRICEIGVLVCDLDLLL